MAKAFVVLAVVLVAVPGCAPGMAPAPSAVAPTSTSTYVQPTPAHEVEITKDIEYVELLQPDAPVQTLDVYAPAEAGPWPVVIVHHFAWQTKDSTVYAGFAEELAGRGAVVFVPQRRSEAATLFEMAEDNGREAREVHESWACAVRFARERAADYGGDPGWVTVFGHGASGLTTALMGDDVQQLWEEFASVRGGPPAQTECVAGEATAHVDAFVAHAGDYEYYEALKDRDPELYELTSVQALVGRDPSLQVHVVHGGMANPSHVERAVQYHEALVNAGYEATWTLLPEGEWQIPWSGPDREALIQLILEEARR